MRGRVVLSVVAGLLLIGLYFSVRYAARSVWTEEKEIVQSVDKNPSAVSEQSKSGVVISFVILFATLVVIGFASAGGGWRNTLSHPTYTALIGVLVGNAMAYVFAYSLWRWLADHPILFWGINIGIVLSVYFLTRPATGFRYIAYGIMGFMIFGLLAEVFGNRPEKPGSNAKNTGQQLPLDLALIDVPVNNWSKKVVSPSIPGTLVVWERLDRNKGGDCRVMRDGDSNSITSIRGIYKNTAPKVHQFMCSEPGAKLKVQVIPDPGL